MSYTHFTLNERKYLQKLLEEGLSMRKIASILARSPSTISREIKRNSAKYKPKNPTNKYWYNHWRATILYIARRQNTTNAAFTPEGEEWKYIVERLNKYWSPESICNRWNMENPDKKKLCTSTVYRYVKLKRFPKISPKTHLRRKGKNKNYVHHNTNGVRPDRLIPQWPEEIKARLRLGDWEGDTIYGGVGKGLLVSMVDRKSRYLKLKLIKSRNSIETTEAICTMLKELPVESISLDNGTEFAEFHKIEQELQTLVYFAEPHKPWQRGTNENTNDAVRFFFPKGFDFRTVSNEDVQYVEDLINNRPKKCLEWKTPYEVFFEKSVALA